MNLNPFTKQSEHRASGPGFIGYLLIIMWFLLTIMTANTAHAQELPETARPIALTATDILPQIEQALTEKGMPVDADIVLKDPQQAIATTGDVSIAYVSFNERSGRFVVRLEGQQTSIAGHARTKETFPVLSRPINRGEIIQETDIAFVETANAPASLFIRDAESLIGKEARRPLRAQTPLRPSDVAAPVLIRKGAIVTLLYDIEGLRLSHQGIALGDGGAGDVISLRNVQSDRILKAVVDGENIARVAAPRGRHTRLKG